MTFLKKMPSSIFFWVQIVCGLIFGVAQFSRMLTTTQGISISWFGYWEAFLVLNLVMALKAHRNHPSRTTWQTIASYAVWTVMITADLALALLKSSWDRNDSWTSGFIACGVVVLYFVARRRKWPISDPWVKASMAVLFKAVPQIMLAYKVYLVGGAGLSLVTLVNGHVTILMRIGLLAKSVDEAKTDRNRIGSAITEVSNELTWIVVTVVWFYR